jgi:hypothetical protein
VDTEDRLTLDLPELLLLVRADVEDSVAKEDLPDRSVIPDESVLNSDIFIN